MSVLPDAHCGESYAATITCAPVPRASERAEAKPVRYFESNEPFDGSASCQLSVSRVQVTPRSRIAATSWFWTALETPHVISVSMPFAAPNAVLGRTVMASATASPTRVRRAVRNHVPSGRLAARSRSSRERRLNFCSSLRGVV